MIQFKFLKQKKQVLVSKHGDLRPWKPGKWRHVKGKVVVCVNGFHASPTPAQAHRFVATNILATVQVGGDHNSLKGDKNVKMAWRSMKVISVHRIAMKDYRAFVKFAIQLPVPQTKIAAIRPGRRERQSTRHSPALSDVSTLMVELNQRGITLQSRYDHTLIATIKDCRTLKAHVRQFSKKGNREKNSAAMTQWWIDRVATMKQIA